MYAGCSSLRDWPGLMAGLAGLSPTRIVRPLITAYLPARPGPGGIGLGRVPNHSGGRSTRREPPAVCNAGRGLEKENIIIKLLAVPPGPCRAGHGRLRFLPNSFWVACHVLGCVWVCVDAGFVRLILIGFCFCTACGECGVFCWCPLLT